MTIAFFPYKNKIDKGPRFPAYCGLDLFSWKSGQLYLSE